MAERNTLRNERRDEVTDNDPFAELARIIGFDPRVKVKAAAGPRLVSSPSPQPAATPAQPAAGEPARSWEDEFSELDFGLGDAASTPVAEVSQAANGSPAHSEDSRGFAGTPAEPEAAASPAPSDREGVSNIDEAADAFEQDWVQQRPWNDAQPADASPHEADRQSVEDEGEPLSAAPEPADVEAQDAPVAPAGADAGLIDSELLLDVDLDNVLAASIERDLGEAWLDSELAPAESAAEGREQSAAADEAPAPARSAGAEVAAPVGTEADFESELAAFLQDDAPAAPVAAVARNPAEPAPSPSQASAAGGDSAFETISDVDSGDKPAVESAARQNHEGRAYEAHVKAPAAPPAAERPRRPQPIELDAAALDDDPFAALAAMAARYRAGQFASEPRATPRDASAEPAIESAREQPEQQAEQPEQPEQDAEVEEMKRAPSARYDAPDVDTVDVPEYAVAVADDLDFPETPYDEPQAAHGARDDVDAEFAHLLDEMSAGEPVRRLAPARAAAYRERPDARFDQPRTAYAAYTPYDRAPAPVRTQPQPQPAAYEDDWQPQYATTQYPGLDDEDPFGDDPEANSIAEDDEGERKPRRRGRWLAALFGSVAIIGGAGAAAMHFTGVAEIGGPLLVKADASPIKIRPENPGGVVVPNQENEVYERVAGAATAVPAQEKLISSAEEPVSLDETVDEEAMLPGVDDGEEFDPEPVAKSEDRVAETAPEAAAQPPQEPIAVTPRKVKTMVVRADGTLVADEQATPEVQTLVADAGKALDTVREGNVDVDATGATASVTPEPAEAPKPVSAAVEPTLVAADAAGGAWSVQIASQPSEDAARSSYADLAQRYSAILGGRNVNIVKAEVSGKGTFWRVRVPAETRSAAADLCASYKAAGGNCFVSK